MTYLAKPDGHAFSLSMRFLSFRMAGMVSSLSLSTLKRNSLPAIFSITNRYRKNRWLRGPATPDSCDYLSSTRIRKIGE